MSTLDGVILSDNLQFQLPFAGLSASLVPGVEQWRMPYRIIDPNKDGVAWPVRIGTTLDTQPLTEEMRAMGGYTLTSFVEDYYNRIHVIPGVLALGAILGTQTRTIEVWNSYFVPRAFQDLAVDNPSGTTLVPDTDTAPVTMAPLRSLTYTLTISAAGPATVNASYRFGFDVGDFYLRVTGQRTAIFPFPPNWIEPVTERFDWLTFVMTSISGREQRIARRLLPRHQWSYTVNSFLSHYQLMDSLLVGWQARVYAFPIWVDAERCEFETGAGAIEIYCKTANKDYHVGGYAILYDNPRRVEAVQIDQVLEDRIVLTKGVDRLWPATRSIVAPGRLGRLSTEVEAVRPTARRSDLKVQFDVEDITNLTPAPESTAYRGAELVMRRPNRATDVTVKYQRLQDRSDTGEGIVEIEDRASRSFAVRSYEFLLRDRADVHAWRKWLHAREGQLKPFWMPVWESNLDIVRPTITTDAQLTVLSNGLSGLLNIDDSRRHIALLHKTGTWYYRRVISYGEGDIEEEEIVFLETAIGIDSIPEDWRIVTFMDYVVGNADGVEIAYLKDDAATCSYATRSVIQ